VTSIADYRKAVDRLKQKRDWAASSVGKEKTELELIRSRMGSAEEARSIFQAIAQAIQQRIHRRISEVVTRCLRAVFDDPYDFEIRFDQKRGKTEAVMVFKRDGLDLEDPMAEVGGGVIDVAALALRLSCILLAKPAVRKVLVLDEPFRFVRGEENRARTCEMLKRLSEDLGVQVVLNTDVPEFRLGAVVEL
jgi:DNA repair exonuclease SbcCD ATPase subunit